MNRNERFRGRRPTSSQPRASIRNWFAMTDHVKIDGSQGEGGGQIVRSSLALSMLTGRPVTIENMRARRDKAGLMKQHLTAVQAAAAICGAKVDGAALGSS